MNDKIAIGIINTYDNNTYQQCAGALAAFKNVYTVSHTSDKGPNNFNTYMSNGALYNAALRKLLLTDAPYLFLIKSNVIVEDTSIFNDYIAAGAAFGTWFMSKGHSSDKRLPIECDKRKVTINLYENLNQEIIFLLKSHVKHCGFFNEGFTNINAEDNVNLLEIYDFYHRLQSKVNYLPMGYFPDIELSAAKSRTLNLKVTRPKLMPYSTDNITKIYGMFYAKNKFIPGKHKTDAAEVALTKLENIQKIYGTNI